MKGCDGLQLRPPWLPHLLHSVGQGKALSKLNVTGGRTAAVAKDYYLKLEVGTLHTDSTVRHTAVFILF